MEGALQSVVSAVIGSLVTALIATVVVGRTIASMRVQIAHLEKQAEKRERSMDCLMGDVRAILERLARMEGMR